MSGAIEIECLEAFKKLFGGDKIDLHHVNGYGGVILIEITNGKVKCLYDESGKFLRKIKLDGSDDSIE